MKCLIIAAGRGSRLSTRADSKPLTPLLGLSLIERVILTAASTGLTDFYVVTGYNGETVRQSLDRLSQARRLEIAHIINEEWEKGNGLSVLKAKDLLHENFILLMADHIFDPSILLTLKNETIADDELILAIDYDIEKNKLVDPEDVTRVFVLDDRILDIGKNMENYNSYDTGIFLCSPAIFSAIEESVHQGDSSLTGAIKVMAHKKTAKALGIEGAYWIDVDDEKAHQKAEKNMLESMRGKGNDGPVSQWLNRTISIQISKYLVNFDITPNQISFVSFLLSVLAAGLFAMGNYWLLALGGIIAQFASIIDGSDGEVARLKYLSSDYGGWFDAVLDRYADAFLLFGLTWYVYSQDLSQWALV
ncbi:MAG: NTP transferase domain-containing protein, partial [Deltaproteobacteria bacterium]|nr:NTP transferase domain-containing protein [Deltaproteobacteria bacterium]